MRARIEQLSDTHEVHVYEESIDGIKAVADYCRAKQDAGFTGTKDVRELATIPGILIQQYCNDNGVSFAEFIRNPVHANRMLNDPALSGFRIHPGRV